MTQRIKSPEDLKALSDKAQRDIDMRSGPRDIQITVHMGTCGIATGARDVFSEFMLQIEKNRVSTVSMRHAGCAGLCDQEPMITLKDKSGAEFRYGKLNKAKVREIVEGHVVGGNPVTKYLVQA